MINLQNKWWAVVKYLLLGLIQFAATMVLFSYLITFIPDASTYGKTQTDRFVEYLNILVTLDFGYSIYYGDTVWTVLLDSGLKSLYLTLSAIVLVMLLAVPLSLYTAFNGDSRLAEWITGSLFLISSVPILVVAVIITLLSASIFGIVPEFNLIYDGSGLNILLVLLLPVASIVFGDGIFYSVYDTSRERIQKTMSQPWIKSVMARGGSVKKHVLRALTETLVISITGKITFLISGIIIVERVFNWQGLGFVLIDIFSQSSQRDYPLLIAVMGVILLFVQFTGLIREYTIMKMNPEKKFTSGL